jgi:hypothetical protein
MKEYIVIASYHGDCCSRAHVMAARVKATNPKIAEDRLARHIREVEQNEPAEVVAYLGFDDIPTLEKIKKEFAKTND